MKSIIVEIPEGIYCARKDEWGLSDKCPLLHKCCSDCRDKQAPYYCSICNTDMHLGEDNFGVLKWNDGSYKCPSLK